MRQVCLIVRRTARFATLRAELSNWGHLCARTADRAIALHAAQSGLAVRVDIAIGNLDRCCRRLRGREQWRSIAARLPFLTAMRWGDLQPFSQQLLDIRQARRRLGVGRIDRQGALQVIALLGEDRHNAAQANPGIDILAVEFSGAAKPRTRREGVACQRSGAPFGNQLLHLSSGRFGHDVPGRLHHVLFLWELYWK